MESLTIGQVARRAGVGVETVRFYERRGLIQEPPRRESGYRQFSADVVDQLRFIKRAQELGFSLREVRELMSLRVTPGCNCDRVLRRTEAKIEDVKARIRVLRRMRGILETLAKACRERGTTTACPILAALGSKGGG